MEIVSKIVLTGGPCAGKTTVLNNIKEYLENKGYKVFIVSETATELINSGIKMFGDNPLSPLDFQRLIFKQQLNKESIVLDAISKYDSGKCVILYDRGLLDNKAYVSQSEFKQLLDEFKLSELEICQRYDAVIHLNTSALIENTYTLENNKARSECKDEAIKLDKITCDAWNTHSNIHVVKPEDDFEIKINNVFEIIDNEILKNVKQNKYLVKVENLKFLNKLDEQVIEQFYIDYNDKEVRLRKITCKNYTKYELCEKVDSDNLKVRKQIKTEISEKVYEKLKQLSSNVINKKRYHLIYNYQHLIIDLLDDCILLETNVDNVDLPSFVKVIEDVSLNKSYRNINLNKTRQLIKKVG